MAFLAVGLALGLIVSIPPGPNSALCVSLASGGVRRALPLITSAALTDAIYSLLAATGILLAARSKAGALEYLIPVFVFATAALSWSVESIPLKVAAAVPLFNPATAAIWLALSSVPALQALSLSEALLRPLFVAVGTATWFGLLAFAAAKAGFNLGPRSAAQLQKLIACLLGVAGLVSLAALLP